MQTSSVVISPYYSPSFMEPQSQPDFRLIEVNLISAQGLKPTSADMRTYAVLWIDSDKKLRSRTDFTCHTNPTWNDKFMFFVPNPQIYTNSVLDVEIYAVRKLLWDKKIGVARVVLDQLVGGSTRICKGMEGAIQPYQVRRPSWKPSDALLNVGVVLMDGVAAVGERCCRRLSPENDDDDKVKGGGRRWKRVSKKGKSGGMKKKLLYKVMELESRLKKINSGWPTWPLLHQLVVGLFPK